MVREHVLKCWPEYFDAVKAGIKPFEVRRDDRGYQRGDMLILQRTGNGTLGTRGTVDRDYHGKVRHELRKRISYVLTGGQFGIEPGYVVLGLAEIERLAQPAQEAGGGVMDVTKEPNRTVMIDYTNWRGERRVRPITPMKIRFGVSGWHAEPQWLLSARDENDKGIKEFAVRDIHAWFAPRVIESQPAQESGEGSP